jgi:plasmid stabilization system protein ParE
MGHRTEENAQKYDELTSVKNDCLRIIHYYYQDKTPTARRKYELNSTDKMAQDAAKADMAKDIDLNLFDFDFRNKDFGYNYYYDVVEDDKPLLSDFKNY